MTSFSFFQKKKKKKKNSNLHLVFAQGFRTPEEVQRFSDMMEEMCWIVATKHSGSLKGEHGTGRNVAPFVEMEWGQKAYQLMWELKELFDPDYVLNPGVILNKVRGRGNWEARRRETMVESFFFSTEAKDRKKNSLF